MEDTINQKSALKTTDNPVGGGTILYTLVH